MKEIFSSDRSGTWNTDKAKTGVSQETTEGLSESHGGNLPEMPHMNWHVVVVLTTFGGTIVGGAIWKGIQVLRGE